MHSCLWPTFGLLHIRLYIMSCIASLIALHIFKIFRCTFFSSRFFKVDVGEISTLEDMSRSWKRQRGLGLF